MPNRSCRRMGLYYLVLKGGIGKDISSADRAYPEFLDVLSTVLFGAGYRLYAFCLLPGQIHLAVQMSHVPLADFVQRLTLKCNQWVAQRQGKGVWPLEQLQQPKLFDRDEKLRELIRFIHLLPLRLDRDPVVYAWSGHRAYVGQARMAWVNSRRGLHLFGSDCRQARGEYTDYFRQGMEAVRTALKGERAAVTFAASAARAVESLDQLIAEISQLGNRHVEDVRSCSRERLCSLLRAVIMWHATRLEFSSATEVAQHLRRDPSSLYSAVKRYSELYPDLFSRPGDWQQLTKLSTGRVNGRIIEARRLSVRQTSRQDCPGPN